MAVSGCSAVTQVATRLPAAAANCRCAACQHHGLLSSPPSNSSFTLWPHLHDQDPAQVLTHLASDAIAELQLSRDELLKGRRTMFAAVAAAARITTVPALRSFLAALGKPAARSALLQWSRKQMPLTQQQPTQLVRPMVRRHSYTPAALPPVFAAGSSGSRLFAVGSVPAGFRSTSAFAAC